MVTAFVPLGDIPRTHRCMRLGKLTTLRSRVSVSPDDIVLVDIGIRSAQEGVDIERYIEYANEVASVTQAYIIVPDAFGNYARTLELWKRYSARFRGKTVFVAQELGPPPGGANHIAIPSRYLTYAGRTISCAREPNVCASLIARYISLYKPGYVHLLGAGAPLIDALLARGVRIDSFDTAAFKLAQTSEDKRRNGIYSSSKDVLKRRLVEYLEKIGKSLCPVRSYLYLS